MAEDYMVEEYIKPAVLVKVDWNQFGTVPNTSTAHVLISMLHILPTATALRSV